MMSPLWCSCLLLYGDDPAISLRWLPHLFCCSSGPGATTSCSRSKSAMWARLLLVLLHCYWFVIRHIFLLECWEFPLPSRQALCASLSSSRSSQPSLSTLSSTQGAGDSYWHSSGPLSPLLRGT